MRVRSNSFGYVEQLGVVLGHPPRHVGVVLGAGEVLVVLGDVQVRVGAEAQEHVEVEVGRARAGTTRSRAAR